MNIFVSSILVNVGTNCLNGTMSSFVGKNLPWSYSTSFYPGESKFSSEFDKRVSDFTGMDARNGGKFQVYITK